MSERERETERESESEREGAGRAKRKEMVKKIDFVERVQSFEDEGSK